MSTSGQRGKFHNHDAHPTLLLTGHVHLAPCLPLFGLLSSIREGPRQLRASGENGALGEKRIRIGEWHHSLKPWYHGNVEALGFEKAVNTAIGVMQAPAPSSVLLRGAFSDASGQSLVPYVSGQSDHLEHTIKNTLPLHVSWLFCILSLLGTDAMKETLRKSKIGAGLSEEKKLSWVQCLAEEPGSQ
ncbi:hypothetical protein K491DRAFT_762903 [Lophiostoma macrostomum CBS 122681]|uniref:Uncharacterized protein n=1 Tax=Lophiostoma macrostomum CBS 122681 TaxID=1314788 RepID=A0A6A6SNY0_9PLEO|nr:hypothetical protein K491DRAFT_762903 [Lophiostoma macrostomum CBS 122681]